MKSTETGSPRGVYAARLAERRARVERHERASRAVSRARIATFVIGLALLALVSGRWIHAAWILAPAIAFLGLVLRHDYIEKAKTHTLRAVGYFESGLARLDLRWDFPGPDGARAIEGEHPYAEHLDLLGQRSLFRLICGARTRPGEDALAAWLLHPAECLEIRARQAAVAELRPQLDERERVALLGEDLRAGVAPAQLSAWGRGSTGLPRTQLRVLSVFATLAITLTLLGWLFWGWGAFPVVAGLAILWGMTAWLRPKVDSTLRGMDAAAPQLDLLSQLLAYLEAAHFESPRLKGIQERLEAPGLRPSHAIRRLRMQMELLDSARNFLFAPLAAILMWHVHVGLGIATWKERHGPAIGLWLEALGEFEALLSLASYSYEHPDDPFPEILESGGAFEAMDLGHPLLPPDECVPNDVRLDDELRLYVVSGSNMSGKSTLLRSVGLNAALALAGAPVRASRLRLSPLQIGASLRIVDSLADGISHFYAEVRRLRQIQQLLDDPLPLLFLLDEIFHGTNSHDRRVGAGAIIRDLVERGAMGFVTTHDLALSEVADALGSRAVNVHFEDQIEDGRMVFDYRMREGVVQRGNALALMRAVGLLPPD